MFDVDCGLDDDGCVALYPLVAQVSDGGWWAVGWTEWRWECCEKVGRGLSGG